MENFIKMDIFFFTTTIFVGVLTVFLVISFYYFYKILKNFHDLSITLKDGVANASQNVNEIVKQVKESIIFRFIFANKKSEEKTNKKSKILKK